MKTFKLIHYTWAIFPSILLALTIGVIVTMTFMTQHLDRSLHDTLSDSHKILIEHVQDRTHHIFHANAFAYNVARNLGSHLKGNVSLFSTIKDKVAQELFMAFKSLSWVSQVSYIGSDGILFSYYHNGDQVRAIFSNMLHYPNDSSTYHLMSQKVDESSGERYGDIIIMPPVQPDKLYILNGNTRNPAWGYGWGNDNEAVLFFTSTIPKIGVVSLGISKKDFAKYVYDIELHGAYLSLYIEDGHALQQIGPPNAQNLDHNVITLMDQYFNLILKDQHMCNNTSSLVGSFLDTEGNEYMFGCASFDDVGIHLVFGMDLPYKHDVHPFYIMKIVGISLLTILISGLVIGSFVMIHLFSRLHEQETLLRANLIKQKEALQQSERKSMNKSLAFASANHDVRTSLASITGLIDICRDDVPRDSELDKNLKKMDACASKLLGILNSVLDISKVEAGRTQLEEVEFNFAHVLEESVDMFHIVALKKGIEVIWDPCDFSILRSSNVKGDCRRLKQILDNLLSNAVKFTSKGHVVVRAWSRRPSLENTTISSRHGFHFPHMLGLLQKWFCKYKDTVIDLVAYNSTQLGPNSIEFVIEVDDTGIGIPKEKRVSVFENYVQVKESTFEGHEGTGLGLGIVQSYVRLMGGEISIQDKELDKRGTCVKFNIFLKLSEMISDGAQAEYANPCNDQLTAQFENVQSNIQVMTFRKGFKMERVQCLLLVQGETKRILQRWMESLGVKVWEVHQWEHLYPMFDSIMHNTSGSGIYDQSYIKSKSYDCNIIEHSTYKDEHDQVLPISTKDVFKKTSSKGSMTYILVVIDLIYVNLSEIWSSLKKFSSAIHNIQYRVVCLASSNTTSGDLRRLKQEPYVLLLQKPCHGSRLFEILRLMQEFGVTNEDYPSRTGIKYTLPGAHQGHNNDKPLLSKNILLVEDTPILGMINSRELSKLGATVVLSKDGKEAISLIKKALFELTLVCDESIKAPKRFPYDAILMDCQMPEMDGYEATKQIRQMEKEYGLHIPVIALTGYATMVDELKAKSSGMDSHLAKPLDKDKLLEALHVLSVC